jgi:hypothetical protein
LTTGIKAAKEELRMGQNEILNHLVSMGACSQDKAMPSRDIIKTCGRRDIMDSLARLRKHDDIKYELRDFGRFYYWVPGGHCDPKP